MLTKRIIPCLDVDAGRVVKGISFVNLRDAGDPVELAALYDSEGADELVFLDITASSDQRRTMVDVVSQVSEQVFIPLTVGGGVRNSGDVRELLKAGADKVAINTAAVLDPHVLSQSAGDFGNQCIVLAIDARRIIPSISIHTESRHPKYHYDMRHLALDQDSEWEVYVHGARTPTGIDAVKWASYGVELGAGEVLITSIDADGHQNGYDIPLTRAIAQAVTSPVIASGGAGSLDHFAQVVTEGKADAALAASVFHYGDFSIRDAKRHLADLSIPVRRIEDHPGTR